MSTMRGGSAGLMRRMGQDPSVANHRLTKGVLWRILRFARPYRRLIAVFIGLVVIAILCAASWFLAPKGENQVSVLSICPPPTGRRRRSLQPAVGAAQLSSPDPTC